LDIFTTFHRQGVSLVSSDDQTQPGEIPQDGFSGHGLHTTWPKAPAMDNIQRYVKQANSRVMFRAGVSPQACELSIRAVRHIAATCGPRGREARK